MRAQWPFASRQRRRGSFASLRHVMLLLVFGGGGVVMVCVNLQIADRVDNEKKLWRFEFYGRLVDGAEENPGNWNAASS